MSQYIEFEGKNVDKAIEAASVRLNKPVEQIRYEVVSHGSSGIFGLVGAKKAKIRIKAEEAFGADADTKAQARDLVKDAFELKDESAPKRESTPRRESAPRRESTSKRESTPKRQSQSKRPNRRPKNNGKGRATQEQPRQEKNKQERVQVDPPSSESIEKAITIGTEALQRMLDFITSDAVIEVAASSQRIIFKVEGGNSGLLIGKRGQTLEAIQYLVEKIVNKQGQERVRVLVDVEGYLKTRKDNLEKMASNMAEKAQKTQKPVTIGQMNAYDRRTVHVYLKSNSKVRTQSVGEGYYRKLIIFPKKRRRNKQPQK